MITGDGIIQLPQVQEHSAEVVMRFSEIGFDGEGLVIAHDGLIQLS